MSKIGVDDLLANGGDFLKDTKEVTLDDPIFTEARAANDKTEKDRYARTVADKIAKRDALAFSAEKFSIFVSNVLGGGYYREIEEREVFRAIEQAAGKGYSVHLRNNSADYLKNWSYIRMEQWNRGNVNHLNLLNGILDIDTLTIRKTTPQDYYTQQIPVIYDPAAKCPIWEKTLAEILVDGDTGKTRDEDIAVLQEFCGYIFHRGCEQERFLVMYGDGANGKGVVTHVIESVVGHDNMTAISLEKFGEPGYACLLFGKMLNLATESDAKAKSWSETLKTAVSGETMIANEKYRPTFNFKPYAKHILTMNEKPYLEDKSSGVTRRLILIPFERYFDEHERDKDLKSRIVSTELSGVFNWMLEGLKRLRQQKGFSINTEQRDRIQELKIESNSVLSFVQDECVVAGWASIKSSDLYKAYEEYCKTNGLKSFSHKKFSGILKTNLGVSLERNMRHRLYKGVDIKANDTSGFEGDSTMSMDEQRVEGCSDQNVTVL